VLQAFCPVREIPKGKVHENVLEAFSIKDKVRGIVICYVLLKSECVMQNSGGLDLHFVQCD